MEEQVRGVLLERDVADLVDNDQPETAQSNDFPWQSAAVVGVLDEGDPLDFGAEQDPVAGMGGLLFLVGPVRVSGLIRETGSGVAAAGCLESAGEELDLLDRVSAHQEISSASPKLTPNAVS